MTNREREILRMASMNISQRSMASALSCSRHYIAKVLSRANELKLSWPLPVEMSDGKLVELLFPTDQERSEGKFLKCKKDIGKIDLLIIDDWMLVKLTEEAPCCWR